MITYSDPTIKFWYEHVINSLKEKNYLPYIKEHNLEYKEYRNWLYRFNPWYGKYKKEKQREIELYDLYEKGEYSRTDFSAKHKIQVHRLIGVGTHRNYLERLSIIYDGNIPDLDLISPKEIKQINTNPIIKTESSSFKLFEPQTNNKIIGKEPIQIYNNPSHEICEPKNDIELSLKQGVKVIVAPETTTDKIVKIIDFLKEL